ncbi:MAG TPA: 2-hydroxy-3-oxopropionate reductase [Ktedonobacteraceae bacterium]|jgi:2-hydroxy-3-oxopropionate reductase|nr:2-hydroxy-3-oxopropionate reductase [Ktedonobacteraceae bacterium]
MAERLGFIGLGLMGKPMARNLLAAGFHVTVYNRSRPAIDTLVAQGAVAASSARQVAEQSDIIITMLPDTSDVETIALGHNSILEGAHDGLLLIDMSTISPLATIQIAARLRERGIHMLDAPVSGGDAGANSGTLSIMVGGEQNDFERAQPIFSALGKTITCCGDHGAGQTVKACNQVVVALIIAAVSEGLVLGSKVGIDPEILLRVLSGGLAQNRIMDLRGPTMIAHHFEPGGKAQFHRKDLGFALQLARAHNVSLPLTALVDQFFTTLAANQQGTLDHSALLTVIETLSNYALVSNEQKTE